MSSLWRTVRMHCVNREVRKGREVDQILVSGLLPYTGEKGERVYKDDSESRYKIPTPKFLARNRGVVYTDASREVPAASLSTILPFRHLILKLTPPDRTYTLLMYCR